MGCGSDTASRRTERLADDSIVIQIQRNLTSVLSFTLLVVSNHIELNVLLLSVSQSTGGWGEILRAVSVIVVTQ